MHKLLARQLRRKEGIGSDEIFARAVREVARLAVEPGLSEPVAQLLAGLPGLLSDVDTTYHQFDRDLELRQRSLGSAPASCSTPMSGCARMACRGRRRCVKRRSV